MKVFTAVRMPTIEHPVQVEMEVQDSVINCPIARGRRTNSASRPSYCSKCLLEPISTFKTGQAMGRAPPEVGASGLELHLRRNLILAMVRTPLTAKSNRTLLTLAEAPTTARATAMITHTVRGDEQLPSKLVYFG